MGAQQSFVIVGAGLAGAKTAEALRVAGFGGRIVLIGEEVERPYERPPLSKDYLAGKSEREMIYVQPKGWYAEHDVDWQPGARVTAIDPAAHQVSREHGEPIGYDKLMLATGASARQLAVPGADPHRVFTLRRVEDCEQLKVTWKTESRVAIVGAGWIGLEVAAAARAAGLDVTVMETAEPPLLRVLGRELAEVFADLHRRHGVDLRLGVEVAEITGDPARATGVRLADGSHRTRLAVVHAGRRGRAADPPARLLRTGSRRSTGRRRNDHGGGRGRRPDRRRNRRGARHDGA
jgi:3-phenylpropionate/trans-cinnamate dioxygenase ferredoxin reductase component